MAEIKRTLATDSQVVEARKGTFGMGFGFSGGEELTVKEVGFVSHEVDGVKSTLATPVIFLEGRDEVIYIRSLIKERYDYQNNLIEHKGTLNALVRSLTGKTLGEVVDTLNTRLKGKKLRAQRITYSGVNRKGEVQLISYNVFDIIE